MRWGRARLRRTRGCRPRPPLCSRRWPERCLLSPDALPGPRGGQARNGFQDPPGQGPLQPAVGDPASAGGLDWVTHRGPFQPPPFCDSVGLRWGGCEVSSSMMGPGCGVCSSAQPLPLAAVTRPGLCQRQLSSCHGTPALPEGLRGRKAQTKQQLSAWQTPGYLFISKTANSQGCWACGSPTKQRDDLEELRPSWPEQRPYKNTLSQ